MKKSRSKRVSGRSGRAKNKGSHRSSGRPGIKIVKHTQRRDSATGRFSARGRKETYVQVFKKTKIKSLHSGQEKYERVATTREKVTGRLFKFYRDPNDVGLHVRHTLGKIKAYSKLKVAGAKGILVKIRGRKRGKTKDTTKMIRIFLDPKQNGNKKYLEKVLTAKILTGMREAGLRLSDRNKRNKDFEYLRDASIEVDYYG
jgi:hypothetical protein